jgi:hypothetical protein
MLTQTSKRTQRQQVAAENVAMIVELLAECEYQLKRHRGKPLESIWRSQVERNKNRLAFWSKRANDDNS